MVKYDFCSLTCILLVSCNFHESHGSLFDTLLKKQGELFQSMQNGCIFNFFNKMRLTFFTVFAAPAFITNSIPVFIAFKLSWFGFAIDRTILSKVIHWASEPKTQTISWRRGLNYCWFPRRSGFWRNENSSVKCPVH